MKCRLLLAVILLTQDSGSFITVQAKSLWIPSPTLFHRRWSSPSTTTKANDEGPLFPTHSPHGATRLQYKRNAYISIINSLRVRGGADGGADGANDGDGEADDGSKSSPQRRRRKKKTKSDTNPLTNDRASGDPVVDSALTVDPELEDGVSNGTEKRVGKRRKLSRMFGRNNNNIDSNDSKVDGDALAVGGDSLVQFDNEDEMNDQTAASDTEGGSSNRTSSSGTKKRRRKRRVGQEVDQADSTEREGSDTTIDSVPESQEISPSDDTPASRIRKKRRKRRAEQAVGEKSSVEAPDEGFQSVIDPINSQSDIQGESLAEGALPTEEKMKKIKRRKRRKVDTSLSDSGETPSILVDADQSSSTADQSTSLAIDASIEIPSEEIVSECTGTTIEIQENLPIDPIEEKSDAEAESPLGSNKKIRRRRKRRESDTTPLDGDAGETVATNSESSLSRSSSELSASIAIDTSIEIPSEEIAPESIGASVDMEENAMPIDPIEEERTGDSPTMAVHVAVDEEKVEPPSTDEIDDADDFSDEGALASNETPTAPVIDEEQTTSVEDEISDTYKGEHGEIESIEEEELGQTDDELQNVTNTVDKESHLLIDASIELPSEEIVPESVDTAHVEPIEVSSSESDAASFAVTVSRDEEVTATATATEMTEDLQSEASETMNVNQGEMAREDASNIVDGESPIDDQFEEENNVEDEPVGDDADEAEGEEGEEEEESTEGNASILEDDSPDTNVITSPTSILIEEDNGVEDSAEVDDAVETAESIQSDSIDALEASKQDSESITKEEIDQTSDELESGKIDDDCLTLSMVTWNLAESAPSEKDASFFKRFRKHSNGVGSDLVMIGAQECEEIKPRRTEGHRSRHLRQMGIMMLGKEYVPLAIHSLGGIQCALYCHRDILGDVEMINIADVTCGVGNVLHNKGAIGVYLKMKRRGSDEKGLTKSSRMLFVTGHLAAHVKNVDARNNDFKRIISELEAQAPTRFLRPRRNRDGSPAECDGSHLLSSMDHVFFAGDLNYRIDLPREYVERCIIDVEQCTSKGGTNNSEAVALMNKLLRRDQLLQTIASGRAFADFKEGKITFLPTFKFDKGTSNYDTSHKQRVPAWTDRILFRSNKVRVLEYQSAAEAKHSDHRPVFGTFQLGWGLAEKTKSKGFAKKPKRTRSRKG